MLKADRKDMLKIIRTTVELANCLHDTTGGGSGVGEPESQRRDRLLAQRLGLGLAGNVPNASLGWASGHQLLLGAGQTDSAQIRFTGKWR